MQRSAYEPLRPLMARSGATCSPKEFYWAVNEAFHDAEAGAYDALHAAMFDSDREWSRLLGALPPEPLEFLDVGAGTGLVGSYLARLRASGVRKLTMLDPNGRMLARAGEKARGWSFPVELVQGDLGVLAGRSFDVVTVSSVLHHVVELAEFCASLRSLMRPGAYLLQMQDPPSGSGADPVLSARRAAAGDHRPTLKDRLPRPVLRGMRAVLRRVGWYKPDPLAQDTNRTLMARGITRQPMSIHEIWAVTDFHVPGQPGGFGAGVSLSALQVGLSDAALVDAFTYEFFGRPKAELREHERSQDAELFAAGDQHGALFGSVWKVP